MHPSEKSVAICTLTPSLFNHSVTSANVRRSLWKGVLFYTTTTPQSWQQGHSIGLIPPRLL